MPGKLNLYGLGQGGVNTDKSPVQLTDDECRSAQNAIFPSDAEGALTKRGSLQRLNSTALNSGANVLAIVNVALPNPFNTSTLPRKYLYFGWADIDFWVRSSDGTTWVAASIPVQPGTYQQIGIPELGLPTLQPVPGRLLYVSPRASIDDFWMFDGTSDQLVLVVPPAVTPTTPAYTAGASGYHLGGFYFGTNDPPDARVYKFDLTTGDLKMIVGAIGTNYTAFSIASYIGQLFVGASDNAAGAAVASYIYRCDPDNATAWTLDSVALTGVPCSMVNFQGNLYIATGSRNAAISMNIYKRTPSGVYSTVFTDATPWNVQQGGAMIEFNDTLFAYMGGNIVKSTNGTAWSVDLDVFTTFASLDARCGMPVVFEGALYWGFRDGAGGALGRLLKRTTGGVWSTVYGPGDVYANLTVFEVP